MGIRLLALLFWTTVPLVDFIVVVIICYNGYNRGEFVKNLVDTVSFIWVSIILIFWVAFTFFFVDFFKSDNKTIESIALYSTLSGLFGVFAAIMAIFIPFGRKWMLALLVASALLANISANMSKFYIIDVYFQSLINKCNITNKDNAMVCNYINPINDPVDKYVLWLNLSTASLAVCTYMFFVYLINIFTLLEDNSAKKLKRSRTINNKIIRKRRSSKRPFNR